jgi:hypothetical protein
MSVLSKLQSVGVELCWDISRIKYAVFEPISGSSPASSALVTQANPLVSCLMLTRGNIELMKYSLACYQRQTYAHRELVIVPEPEAAERVRTFIASQKVSNVAIFVPPPGLTIGDHRNLAAARASGAILVTWDDDDLSDPLRIESAVKVLLKSSAAAAFLSRVLIWWPQRRVAAISERNAWEQSMAVWRSYVPIFPPLSHGEDTAAIKPLIRSHDFARIDCPLLYVYAVTGQNSWSVSHFEEAVSLAECVFEGDEFDELNGFLSDRLPLLDYMVLLNEEVAPKPSLRLANDPALGI